MKIMDQQFFQKLVSHEDFIVKDDFTLYKLIKKWALVNFKHKVISNYCRKWSRKDKNPFLMTEHGRPYVKLFKVLRLNNIILNNKDFESLKKDNIIPLDWIKDAVVAFSSQMKAICSGTDATFLTSFPKDAFRVGIFHSDEAQTFTEKFINYYGIHLRLNWSDGVFSLYRHKRESIYDHGTCSLQLRLTLYTPETAVEREAYENILVIKQLIKEDETIILFKKEHSNVTGNIEAPVDPSRMFLHERELFFPTTIGIDLLYLSGAQDKQLNDK